MTSQEQQLVAALLRCAAASNLHEVLGELGPAGRLTNAAWEAFYRARGDAGAAAVAIEGGVIELADLRTQLDSVRDALLAAEAERDRLFLLINTPRIDDFFEAVRIEAAHQVERWGVEHDAGKQPEDWVVLVVYLLGKATTAHFRDDTAKLLHHVITLGAVACNWHANMTGSDTRMRPGLGDRVDADAQLAVARRALRAALGTWCPRDPGGDGADGETYRLCIEALEVRE